MAQNEILAQYDAMKAKHADALVIFRVGDSYQLFKQDAKDAIDILGTPYRVLSTEERGDIVTTEFHHTKLDEYLPKLVRAGRRCAICEEPADTKPTVKRGGEPTASESKQEPKTNKKMKARKDTIIEGVKYLDEEPFAWLTLRIPKDAKDCGKSASKEQITPTMTAIMVEPDNNKMVVSNTRILHAYDVECKGAWPKDRNTPFQFYIEPKDIARLAGQEVDVVVWKAEVDGRKTEIATCEVVGTITECDYKGVYPNWQRVMPKNDGHKIQIVRYENDMELLRKWVKENMGKTKQERENRRIILTAAKGGKVELAAYEADYATSDTLGERLAGYSLNCDTPINLKIMFNAELFYYSILPDFDGNIWVKDYGRPVKFCGKTRESVLMPMCFDGAYCTVSDEIETFAQRQQRESEERERKINNESDNQTEEKPF